MLPKLRIVETKQLVVHETVDPARVERLKKRFEKGGKLNNPPIVAPLGKGKYVVLDGANRVTVALQLGFPHLIVQVVHYGDPTVGLLTWNHVVEGVGWARWWNSVKKHCGDAVGALTLARACHMLARGRLCAYVISPHGTCYGIRVPSTEKERVKLWNAFVETYKGKYTLHRTVEDTMASVRRLYPKFTALIVFPPLKKADILHFARNGLKIPSGISRHVIPGRALHVDVPFELLRARRSVASKNAWLIHHVEALTQSNQIRYYSEPVYLYDE